MRRVWHFATGAVSVFDGISPLIANLPLSGGKVSFLRPEPLGGDPRHHGHVQRRWQEGWRHFGSAEPNCHRPLNSPAVLAQCSPLLANR